MIIRNRLEQMQSVPADIFGWVSTHWGQIASVAAVFVANIIELATIPSLDTPHLIVTILHFLGIALIVVFPRDASTFVVLVFIANQLLPTHEGLSQLCGLWLAIWNPGFAGPSWLAYGSVLLVGFVSTWKVAPVSDGLFGRPYVLIGSTVLFLFIGQTLRWNLVKAHTKATEARLHALEHDAHLAMTLHDATTGGLSFIALTAQREAEMARDNHWREAEIWEAVNQQATATIDGIHEIIALLDKDSPPDADDAAPSGSQACCARLRSFDAYRAAANMSAAWKPTERASAVQLSAAIARKTKALDKNLSRLGINGTTSMRGSCVLDDAQTRSIILDLLQEIYTNLARHCSAQGTYNVFITLDDSLVKIRETNDVSADPSAVPWKESGMGLQFHRQRLATIGGILNTALDDDSWILFAVIPIHRQQAD
ncbi:MAG: hypothetical protein LKF49_09020 [Bifidobacterium tibiigranuli]|jgi:hypothetical protein|uniref:hypothetical protein n=1 Tax=Bifidobacterium tibiigranuli TaxID=2172043 RepID=UPI002353AFA9|nr:hypothetical protein [Bifidobacterium tibiigranuli]MCH3974587.1 hypothetical protein [Bifidobacterium tibiigranuli]MCH4189505.1 hypothetical protein [Bifidobacterium tibiigranuli]MCH4204328.1 hypothetical protein [Bifidobacterium tibiigranuli]MCH4275375.1 hypothetical protein [Bifidobacterium tibiigranuli]